MLGKIYVQTSSFRLMLSSMSAAMIFLDISEIIRDSDFKIYHHLTLDSLYISTGNDITSYFRSAANRTNVNFASCSSPDFSITVQPIFKMSILLETVIQARRLNTFNLLGFKPLIPPSVAH